MIECTAANVQNVFKTMSEILMRIINAESLKFSTLVYLNVGIITYYGHMAVLSMYYSDP